MLVDTHAHLNDEKFNEDFMEALARAKAAGVEKVIVPGLNVATSRKGIEIAERNDDVHALVGVHPEEVIQDPKFQVTVDELVEIIESSKKVVGVGEIGMDFYWDREKKTLEEQEKLFEMQLRIAHAMGLPVMIHSRGAGKEVRALFEKLDFVPRGQFHCFGEDEESLKYVLEKGFYVSFCGNITYKTAEDIRKLAKVVPLDRLLIETDSPYLSPEGRRGERNEPANVRITAEFLAELRGEELDNFMAATTKNARELWNLE